MDFTEIAYGTKQHRRAPRHPQRESNESMGREMMELGKVAVGGMVTIGVLGAVGSMLHKD